MEAITSALSEKDQEITVVLPDKDGKDTNFTGLLPTGDQIAMFVASSSGATNNRLGAVMDLIEDTLGEEQLSDLKARIRDRHDPLTFEIITEAIIEAVTDFPTPEPSGSTSTPTRTGGRSTGRVRSQESAPST